MPNGGGLKGVRVGGRWRAERWGRTPVCGRILSLSLSLSSRSGMLDLSVETSVRDQPPTCVYGPRLRRKAVRELFASGVRISL